MSTIETNDDFGLPDLFDENQYKDWSDEKLKMHVELLQNHLNKRTQNNKCHLVDIIKNSSDFYLLDDRVAGNDVLVVFCGIYKLPFEGSLYVLMEIIEEVEFEAPTSQQIILMADQELTLSENGEALVRYQLPLGGYQLQEKIIERKMLFIKTSPVLPSDLVFI